MGDLGSIFVLSLVAMFTPTLLAAATVMMLLPNPRRLMLGYLLGAYLTSIGLGLLIVFELDGTAVVESSKTTLGPGEDLVLGALLLIAALVLRSGRAERRRQERRRRRGEKRAAGAKESLPERLIGRGDPRITFVVAIFLTLPGVSYLTALERMARLDANGPETVLLVVGFCVIQLALIELPLLGFVLAPERTKDAVARLRAWLAANGRRVATAGAAVLGSLMVVRGVIELIVA